MLLDNLQHDDWGSWGPGRLNISTTVTDQTPKPLQHARKMPLFPQETQDQLQCPIACPLLCMSKQVASQFGLEADTRIRREKNRAEIVNISTI